MGFAGAEDPVERAPEVRVELPGLTPITTDEVRLEIETIHRREIAELLRGAAAIAVRRASYHGVWASFPVSVPGRRSWLAMARATLERISSIDDGGMARPSWHLLQLLDRPDSAWPGALRLARLARRLQDGEWARLCVGHALLAEGDAESAVRVFSQLMLRSEVLRHRWRALEGLALGHAASGRARVALGAIESAADEPDCSIGTLVEGLHLALLVGEYSRVRRAAARLDLLLDGGAPAMSASLAMLRRRHSLELFQLRGSGLELANSLARESHAPSGRVAQASLGI